MILDVPLIDYDEIPGKVIYEVIVGSHSQNLSTRRSFVDIKGVFVASKIDIYSCENKKTHRVNDNIIFYELTHFINLLKKGDLQAIEMIHTKKEFIKINNPIFDEMILRKKSIFITRRLFDRLEVLLHSSLDNMIIDTSQDDVPEDLNPINFISYANETKGKHEPLSVYLKERNLKIEQSPEKYAFKKIPTLTNMYHIYYDVGRTFCTGIIIKENQLLESNNIPSTEKPIGVVHFDRTKYINSHKKESSHDITYNSKFKSGAVWSQDKEQKHLYYDRKGMCHCMRIMITFIEYLDTNVLNVYREHDRNYLFDIKNGDVLLDNILSDMKYKADILRDLYKDKFSEVKDGISDLYAKHIIVDVRERIYAQILAMKRLQDAKTKVY